MKHRTSTRLSRRAFIATAATVGFAATQGESHAIAPLRAGLIGCGTGGQRVMDAMALSQGAVLPVACAARSGALSRGALTNVEHDWCNLVQRKDLDVIFIATPDHLHAEMATEALRAGKHVYIMPPFARSGDEARQLVALAQDHRRVLHVGMDSGEVARWARVKASVARTGAPLWIQATATREKTSGESSWQRDRAFSHGPASRQLFNMLYPLQHNLAWKAPQKATVLGGVFHGQPENTPDRVLMTLRYDNGATVVLECADRPGGPSLVRGVIDQIELPPPTGSPDLVDDLKCFAAAIAGDCEESSARLRAACIAQETVCSAMERWARWESKHTV